MNYQTLTNTEAYGNVSDKYKLINTGEVVSFLQDNLRDWAITDYKESRVVKKEKQGKQRHLVTFKSNVPIDGELCPTLSLLNSYDRMSRFSITAGLFRSYCSNGLIIGADYGSLDIRHTLGDWDKNNVLGFIKTLPLTLAKATQSTALMKVTQVDQEKAVSITTITKSAFKLIHGDWEDTKLESHASLWQRARRTEDRHDNLWCAYNRVQEHVIRGAYAHRGVKRLDTSMKLNKFLWNQFTGLLPA